MSDLWNNLKSFQMGRTYACVSDVLEQSLNSQKHSLVVTAMHQMVVSSVVEFCIQTKKRALILVPDAAAANSWEQVFYDRVNDFEKAGLIYGTPQGGFMCPLFPIVPYSNFGSGFDFTADQRQQARDLRQRELSAIPATQEGMVTCGDLDAIQETDALLTSFAYRNYGRYLDDISPLIEGDTSSGMTWESALLESLASENLDFIIVHGAERIGGTWMAALEKIDKTLNKPLIGFSAYRPEDAFGDAKAKQKRQNFFGAKFTEIKQPYLATEGACRPWRELVSFVEPERSSEKVIEEVIGVFEQLIDDLNNGSVTAVSLNDYVQKEMRALENDMPGNWGRRQDWMESILYYGRSAGILSGSGWEVFLKRIPDDKFELNLLVYREYIFNVLLESGLASDRRLGEKMISQVKKIGYLLSEKQIRPYSSVVSNILGRAESREKRLLELLEREWMSLEENFRGLVVADFTDSSSYAEHSFIPDSSTCGLMSIFWRCQENEVILQMNPVLIWETTIYCSPRYASRMQTALDSYVGLYEGGLTMEVKNDGTYCYFEFSGSQLNSAVWTWLVSRIMAEGVSLCLLANRDILLNKWSGLAVNTIFNLTMSHSKILRKRLERRLSDTGFMGAPAAHLWDIIPVMPEMQGGLAALHSYAELQEESWNIAEDGVFEKGISHVSPLLGDDLHRESEVFQFISNEQLKALGDRSNTAQAWKQVGASVLDTVEVVELYYSAALSDEGLCRIETLDTKAKVKNNYLDYPGVIKNILNALAMAYCDLKHQPFTDRLLKLDISQRNDYTMRVQITGDPQYTQDYQKMVLELFASFSVQHYVLTATVHMGASEGGLLSRSRSALGKKHEAAFAVPEMFNSKTNLAYLNRRWQELVSTTKIYSLRIPQTQGMIERFTDDGVDLRPSCYQVDTWVAQS